MTRNDPPINEHRLLVVEPHESGALRVSIRCSHARVSRLVVDRQDVGTVVTLLRADHATAAPSCCCLSLRRVDGTTEIAQ